MPIHGHYSMLSAHADLAESVNIPREKYCKLLKMDKLLN